MMNETVSFRVVRHLPLGLRVRLGDGRPAIIRVREISWDADERRRWEDLYPVGWESQAIVVKDSPGEQLELSLRLAANDPWDDIEVRFRTHQVIPGVVSGVEGYGAFVEIASGLVGLLHKSELLGDEAANPLDLFWPGDHVLVRILRIDARRRRIGLGLAKPQIETARKPRMEGIPVELGQEPLLGIQSSLERLVQEKGLGKKILVIEDDQDQGEAIVSWLEKTGLRARVAINGADGLEAVEQEQPDIILIDLGLPDVLGTELARQIRHGHPQVRCILNTDWARADEHTQELTELRNEGVEFLLKPLLPEDLINSLLEAQPDRADQGELQPRSAFRRDQTVVELSNLPVERALGDLLEECRQFCEFDAAVLFALDPVQRTVEIVACRGDGSIKHQALSGLVYSPVRDVAEDGDLVEVGYLSEGEERRFRYLTNFYPLAACLGVQVPSGITRKHALMLLDRRGREILASTVAYVQAVALALGSLLERKTFQEQAIFVQRTALLGHLTRGLVHEINHQISPLNFSLGNLKGNLEALKKNLDRGNSVDRVLLETIANLDDLQKSVRAITSTTRQFGRILTRPREEILRVDEIVREAFDLLRDNADRDKVKLSLVELEDLVLVRSQGAALEHVLINILLNAIQQIVDHRGRQGGWVQVSIHTDEVDGDVDKCRILVQDNGPGIHVRQWDQVFEVGFTTREEGGGMGLYISRSLMEAIGGRLYVEESYILGGTVFAIELPRQL
jgi:signal transduction histidine kinase/DNA-binding response OmpR family regulator